jgi:hypothetical protein
MISVKEHFRMDAPQQQTHPFDWDAVKTWAQDEITARLRSLPEFLSAEILRGQCCHACRLLREEHPPVVPFSTLSHFLDIVN